jgi:hypothetical protein
MKLQSLEPNQDIIGENLSPGKHTLHIKIIDAQDEGTNGHYFQLLNVLTAEKSRP